MGAPKGAIAGIHRKGRVVKRRQWHEDGCFASCNAQLEARGAERRHGCSCPSLTFRTLKRSSTGAIRIAITCPRCKEETLGWLWSFMGSGKKCEGCGALMKKSGVWTSDVDDAGEEENVEKGKETAS